MFPDFTQTWYAYDAVELNMYDNIELYFNFQKRFGPKLDYKSVALTFFWRHQ